MEKKEEEKKNEGEKRSERANMNYEDGRILSWILTFSQE